MSGTVRSAATTVGDWAWRRGLLTDGDAAPDESTPDTRHSSRRAAPQRQARAPPGQGMPHPLTLSQLNTRDATVPCRVYDASRDTDEHPVHNRAPMYRRIDKPSYRDQILKHTQLVLVFIVLHRRTESTLAVLASQNPKR